jgi:hypothetical protein
MAMSRSVALFRYLRRGSVLNGHSVSVISLSLLRSTTSSSKLGCVFAQIDNTVSTTNRPRLHVPDISGGSSCLNSCPHRYSQLSLNCGGVIFAPVPPAKLYAAVRTICEDNCVDPSARANWRSGKLRLSPCHWRICASPIGRLAFLSFTMHTQKRDPASTYSTCAIFSPSGPLPRASSNAR